MIKYITGFTSDRSIKLTNNPFLLVTHVSVTSMLSHLPPAICWSLITTQHFPGRSFCQSGLVILKRLSDLAGKDKRMG